MFKRYPSNDTCTPTLSWGEGARTSLSRMPSARCSVTTLLLAPSSMLSSAGLFCFSSFRLQCNDVVQRQDSIAITSAAATVASNQPHEGMYRRDSTVLQLHC